MSSISEINNFNNRTQENPQKSPAPWSPIAELGNKTISRGNISPLMTSAFTFNGDNSPTEEELAEGVDKLCDEDEPVNALDLQQNRFSDLLNQVFKIIPSTRPPYVRRESRNTPSPLMTQTFNAQDAAFDEEMRRMVDQFPAEDPKP